MYALILGTKADAVIKKKKSHKPNINTYTREKEIWKMKNFFNHYNFFFVGGTAVDGGGREGGGESNKFVIRPGCVQVRVFWAVILITSSLNTGNSDPGVICFF